MIAALICLISLFPEASAADRALIRRLEREIAKIPYVDSHCHIPAPGGLRESLLKGGKYDVAVALGQSTYAAEFTPGGNWEEVREALKVNAHHAYYRPFLEAFRDLYGLASGEELEDGNVERVSRKMEAAHREPGWYAEVLRRANVSDVIWLNASHRGREEMPLSCFHPVWNVDGDLVFIDGKAKKGDERVIDGVEKKFGGKLKTLKEMDGIIEREIAGFFERGGVGLKSTAAYFRRLDFDAEPPRGPAVEAFAKVVARKDLTGTERKALQDHLMARVLSAAAKHKKPIQFHTGNQQNWGMLEWSDPVALNPLLYTGKFWDAKFVLLHGGYPYSREAITLTRYFGNVYLDLAWMALFSPAAAKRVLSEALDMLDGRHLMIGTDTANLEEFYGTVKITRRVVAEVLAEKIEGGYLSEDAALAAARRILNRNAIELYGL